MTYSASEVSDQVIKFIKTTGLDFKISETPFPLKFQPRRSSSNIITFSILAMSLCLNKRLATLKANLPFRIEKGLTHDAEITSKNTIYYLMCQKKINALVNKCWMWSVITLTANQWSDSHSHLVCTVAQVYFWQWTNIKIVWYLASWVRDHY